MKLNAQGQILDAAGKVVGNLSDLQLDAAALTKHFAAQTSELIDSAVAAAKAAAAETEKAALATAIAGTHVQLQNLQTAVGAEKAITAFVAGKTVEQAKAELADDLAAALKSRDEEIAKLKSGQAQTPKTPGFVASDAGQAGTGKPAKTETEDKDAPFAADWDANKDACQDKYGTLTAYAAHRRYLARRSA